jgi:glycosyltransferase involved in cell wall biosynthesis
MVKIDTLEKRGIYTDLLRKFRDEGHNVYVVSPSERRDNKPTSLVKENGCNILNVKTFNLQKTNIIEKGVGILAIEYQYLNAIKNNLKDVKFDLILYSTPPITFSKVISYIKKRDNAFSYLLLKDIFPQNAVDLGMMKERGILHKIFLKKENKLYEVSDKIGCMSPANVKYIAQRHPGLIDKLEVNPNSIELTGISQSDKNIIRKKYNIPTNHVVFVYGGNLGKPQGIEFLREIIISSNEKISNAYFLIIGNGTEYRHMLSWFNKIQPMNAMLIEFLPKQEYDELVKGSDVGMIFLNPNFTIPNFPSRLLTYLEFGLPVFSATDSNTDIPEIIEKHRLGYGVISGDLNKALEKISELTTDENLRNQLGQNANSFLKKNYDVTISFNKIIASINV